MVGVRRGRCLAFYFMPVCTGLSVLQLVYTAFKIKYTEQIFKLVSVLQEALDILGALCHLEPSCKGGGDVE